MKQRKRKRAERGLWYRFGAWLDKRWATRHPLELARRVDQLARVLGERRGLSEPSRRERLGYVYEDVTLTLEATDTGMARIMGPDPVSVRVLWLGHPVFECDCDEVTRFNYGEVWIGAVDQIYSDLTSKQRRAAAARFHDIGSL